MITTVGRFTFDDETGALSGPKAYLESEHYRRCMERIETGRSAVFEVGIQRSPDVITALLVAVQTDYAGWRGSQQLFQLMEHRD